MKNIFNKIHHRKERLEDEIFALRFDAGKSIRYHNHLRSFWLRVDHWNKVITSVLGTSVAVSVIAQRPMIEIATGLLTAVFGSLDIVIGFSDKVLLYESFYKRWYDYLAIVDGVSSGELTEKKLIQLTQERYQIERDEPGVFRLMERYSSAEEAIARGAELNEVWKLNRIQKIICWISG